MAIEDDLFFGTAYNSYDEGFLVLPFPYDEGFSLTVNGDETEVKKVFGTFIGIPLKP